MFDQLTRVRACASSIVLARRLCPIVIDDPKTGIHSDIILTSDSFAGVRGHESAANSSDYEIFLYDERGNPAGSGNPIRLSVQRCGRQWFLFASCLMKKRLTGEV